MTACIGEPISWPRLEQFALDAADPQITTHVAACAACRQCLAQIQGDVIELPALVLGVVRREGPAARAPELAPAAPRRRRWIAPVFAAAAMVIVVLVVRRPAPDGFAAPIGLKGGGEVTLELVRERGGAIEHDARSYAPGDRWKIILSCAPRASAVTIDVSVADGLTTDHPLALALALAPAQLACGNGVVVPGAFTVTGTRANRVCVTVAVGGETGTACATLLPE